MKKLLILLLLVPGLCVAQTRPSHVQISNKPLLDVRELGAKCDNSTDDTAAIQAAINCALASGSGGIYLPGKSVITDTLTIKEVAGFRVQGGLNDFRQTGNVTLRWAGTTAAPMIEIAGDNAPTENVCYGVDIRNVSLIGEGDTASGTATATVGIFYGVNQASYSFVHKFFSLDQVFIRRCRMGMVFGHNASQSDDILGVTANSMNIDLCPDAGIMIDSGNAAAHTFTGCQFSQNGWGPTTDGLNPSGIGANVYIRAGGGNFTGCTSSGLSTYTPTTADIYLTGNNLRVNGWWSDTHGLFLKQAGAARTLYLNGVRHYEGTMSSATTPLSIESYAKMTSVGGYYYGAISLLSGQSGCFTSIADQFVAGGPGKFSGSLVESGLNGLVRIGNTGNAGTIQIGGNATNTTHVGLQAPKILTIGSDNLAVTLQALSDDPDTASSGASIYFSPNSGAWTMMTNCYVASTTGAVSAHIAPAPAYLIKFGSISDGGILCSQYNFIATDSIVAKASFVDIFGIKRGLTSTTASETCVLFPHHAAHPTYASGDYWEGCIYYSTTSSTVLLNAGGSVWKDLQ